MNQRIVYNDESGKAIILIPSPNCGLTLDEMARKDVPEGKPYKIISVEDIPTDRTFREAWEFDMSNPDGYGIGHEAWFAQREGL